MPAHNDFHKKKPMALVTGASKRLGKEILFELGRMGYAVGLHYHSSEAEANETSQVLEAEGIPVYCLKADLRNEREILEMFKTIADLPYSLEVLVNSASVFKEGDLSQMDGAEWDDIVNVNLKAPWLCAREAARLFSDGKGVIINISDSGANKVWTKYPVYILTKSALEHLTRLLARSLGPDIRVNAIAPGLIEKSGEQSDEDWQRLVNRLPLGKAGDPDSITKAIRFLIENEYITGEILVIDGGYRLL